jgi:hypothetical protein
MNWKPTWILVGLAAMLFAFITLFERHVPDPQRPPARLFTFRAGEVTNIQVRITNQLVLRVERLREDSPWNLSLPLPYPAQPFKIQRLLQTLEQALPQTEISAQDLRASKRSLAEFGLDIPQATLTLQHEGQRTEVHFGAPTPVGDGVYAQLDGHPGIYILNGEFAASLPRSHHDWRDTALFISNSGYQFNGVEVRAGGRGWAFELDATNRVFVLTKPTVARADPGKVDALLRKLLTTQVEKFVSDSPRVELENYGLQPPELELALLKGTNEVFTVQFGSAPTNDSAAIYVRRVAHTNANIVLVPRAALDTLLVSHADLRDLHLVNWSTNVIDAIDVIGSESFSIRRQTNGAWMLGDAQSTLADTNAVVEFLDALSRLEGTVEKDVVTDFANPYRLAPPQRQYLLRTTVANPGGAPSNRVVAELQLGVVQDGKVFARRPDEQAVYGLAQKDVVRLPYAAWQMRDRQVFRFTTNQVQRVSVRYEKRSLTLQRNSSGAWSTANAVAVDEVLARLGNLRAVMWLANREEDKPLFGFHPDNDRIVIELRTGDKPQELLLEFAGQSPTQLPFAASVVDGRTAVFEFPPVIWFDVIRTFFSPLFRPGNR